MKRRNLLLLLLPTAVVALSVASVAAHDLFLRPSAFFVSPHATVSLRVLNGTFTSSEAPVRRERLRHTAIIAPDARMSLDTSMWDTAQKWSTWRVRVGVPGTYLVAASLFPRTIRLDGMDFNRYLEEDGLPDILSARRRSGELGTPARERYSKHVKTLIQVGARRTANIDTVFGYPAELVPLDNPYLLRTGSSMRVRALVDGLPVANQYILAGGRNVNGNRIPEKGVRTNSDGVAIVTLSRKGSWYVKFIAMKRIDSAAGDSVDYESKWATLTFGIR